MRGIFVYKRKGMMTNDQTYTADRDEFIARLMSAGWTKADALKEWNEVQGDEEGEL
jgi:hypothetical protein